MGIRLCYLGTQLTQPGWYLNRWQKTCNKSHFSGGRLRLSFPRCAPLLSKAIAGPESYIQQLNASICQLCGCVRKLESCSKIYLPIRLQNHWSRAVNKFSFQKLHFSGLISWLRFMPCWCCLNLLTLISSLTLSFLPIACLCLNLLIPSYVATTLCWVSCYLRMFYSPEAYLNQNCLESIMHHKSWGNTVDDHRF